MKIPVELLLTISKHLDNIRDIVKLRLVCKEWRWFVDEFCLDELVLFVGVYPTLELWKTNSKPIDFKKVISFPSDRCPLDDTGFRYTFRNIKRLFLSIRSEKEVSYQLDFDKLNKLEIARYYSLYAHARTDHDPYEDEKLKSEVSFQLNLPSLTTFHINELDENIVMDCPKVTLFSYDFIEHYSHFDGPMHYLQIKQLNCYYAFKRSFGPKVHGYDFECHKWIKKDDFIDVYDPHFLKYFPKLKILFFHGLFRFTQLAIEEEKKNLNRTDLVIYYLGKRLDERINRLHSYGRNFCYGSFIEFYRGDDLTKLTNLAPTLPQYDSMSYNATFDISNDLNKQFYKAFFKKLTDLQVLSLEKPSHTQEEIIELINCFKNIVILRIWEVANLGQSFYDILPDRYPYLRVLKVDNRRLENLKLNFLFKFSDLYRIKFINLEFVQHKSDYKELMQKIERKRDEILRINGTCLFNIDKEMKAPI